MKSWRMVCQRDKWGSAETSARSWGKGRAVALLVAVSIAGLLMGACGGAHHAPDRRVEGSAVDFVYYTADGERISSAAFRGRVTVVLFVTTFDAASQLEARELQAIVRRHTPRINAVVVVLEAPQYAPLTAVYAETLELSVPVVLSDYAARTGQGPFGELGRVPTVFVLDELGRVRWSKAGSVPARELEQRIRDWTGPPPKHASQ